MHSEIMGVYILAKKRPTVLIIQMQYTMHSKKLGVYRLARKITFSMHEKIDYFWSFYPGLLLVFANLMR